MSEQKTLRYGGNDDSGRGRRAGLEEERGEEAMRLPMIEETDCLILGGSTQALREAFRLSQEGRRVTMAVSDTFLAGDLCGTNRYSERDRLEWVAGLPDSLFQGNGVFYPDRLKLYLEELCREREIRLFYFLWKVEVCERGERKLVKLAGKGGLFGILCREVKEMAEKEEDLAYRVFVRDNSVPFWSLFCAQRGKSEGKTAENLYRCREAVLKEYAAQKKAHQGWHLGRFAVRGYDPESGSGRAEEKCEEPMRKRKAVRIRVENEMIRFQKYPVLTEPDTLSMEIREYDLVIAGGGTAGAMAAIHGARRGLKTVVIEPNYELGGTGTVGGVTTYWFGRRFRDVMEIDEEVKKVSRACGLEMKPGVWSEFEDFHAGIKAQVYLKKCLEAGVEIAFGQIAFGAVMNEDGIAGVATAGEEGNVAYMGRMILDATGDGDIAAAAGAGYETGNGRDCISDWASLAQYLSGETYRNNFSCTVMSADPRDYTDFILNGRKRGGEIFDHGTYVSMRESRHIRGKCRLTLRDLLTFRKYPDGLYTCFSNYDPKGKVTADLVYAGVLPPQVAIQIPLSALEPVDLRGKGIRGLYVLGKAISASHDLFPSIRMQPDLMHQGAVMGELAAVALSRGILPEDLPEEEIRKTAAETTGDLLELPEWNDSSRGMVWRIQETTRSHWVDVPFSYEEKGQNPLIAVMCAGAEDVLSDLRERLQLESGESLRRLLIGCALWHGEDGWTEEFCEMLCRELEAQGTILPEREGSVSCVQLLPDHGVMPETAYRLNLLAWSRKACILEPFRLVLAKLERSERDYRDIRKGTYHYVEAFAYAAERSGRKEFSAMLRKLLAFGEFREILEKGGGSDPMAERMGTLALSLCRSLARLGESDGYAGLIALLGCRCVSVACSACRELEQLTGAGHGLRPEKWEAEVAENGEVRKVQRIRRKVW